MSEPRQLRVARAVLLFGIVLALLLLLIVPHGHDAAYELLSASLAFWLLCELLSLLVDLPFAPIDAEAHALPGTDLLPLFQRPPPFAL